jgi:uncharacterized SAM-binding protein YcdF (DUF218 family)
MIKIFNKIVRLVFGLALVFVLGVIFIIFTPLSSRMASTLTVDHELAKADIIAVLGAGAYENGVLGGASLQRMTQGLLLHKAGYAPRVIFLGGSITDTGKKVLHTMGKGDDSGKADVAEGLLMRDTAVSFGLERSRMHGEGESTHTYANIVALQGFMNERGYTRCLIVSSPVHMRRVMGVVERLGVNCNPAPVEDYTPYVTSAMGRLNLFYAVTWEYAAMVLYKYHDYID